MTSRSILSVNIKPNEIVFPGARIAIDSSREMDAAATQAAVAIGGIRGVTAVTASDSTISREAAPSIAPGRHWIRIDELVTPGGDGTSEPEQIPFFVTDSKARIPASLLVTHMTRLRIGELMTERLSSQSRPDGPYIEIMKAEDRKTGEGVELAFDEIGLAIDAPAIFRRIANARQRKYGKLHETLYARLSDADPEEQLPVAIWLRCDALGTLGNKRETGATVRPTADAKARRREVDRTLTAFLRRYGARLPAAERDPIAPVIYADLSPGQIREMAGEEQVVGLFLHEREGFEDLAASMAVARSDQVHAVGFTGTAVRVAIWENGPDVTSDLTIADRFQSSGFATSEHSRHTHGIVKNVEPGKPHGHAPNCELFSANSKSLLALSWAHKSGCTVISQSFHRASEPHSATKSYDDIYKDFLALEWPYPTIFQAAGNFWSEDPDGVDPPAAEYVNHKGYNSLAVGNHNDTASAMSGDSVFRNPSSRHGDRELPEIAANGTRVEAVKLTKSGTSMASPAAAGCCALIQEANRTLKHWPEGCRAIFLAAAARNIAGSTWWLDNIAGIDASDGSGAVDALAATRIARKRRRKNAAAAAIGWDIGRLTDASFDRNGRSTFAYTLASPRTLFAPNKVKVALAWTSRITTKGLFGLDVLQSELTVDLDLEIFDSSGARVGYSGSWDNSYEIAEFVARRGETYQIKIRRWSGIDDVWFGIAWTTTGGFSLGAFPFGA